jgi:hypothetical protein
MCLATGRVVSHVCEGHLDGELASFILLHVLVYAVVDDSLSPNFPLGDALEVYISREDAERFVKEVRGDESELAKQLRIEEREREAGGLN